MDNEMTRHSAEHKSTTKPLIFGGVVLFLDCLKNLI